MRALVINGGDPVSQRLGLIPLAGLHQGPHLFGQGIALVTQLFQAGQELAPLGLPPAKLLQGNPLAPVSQGLFHFCLVFAHKLTSSMSDSRFYTQLYHFRFVGAGLKPARTSDINMLCE